MSTRSLIYPVLAPVWAFIGIGSLAYGLLTASIYLGLTALIVYSSARFYEKHHGEQGDSCLSTERMEKAREELFRRWKSSVDN